jgi:Fic family protein
MKRYIYQIPKWPNFEWDAEKLAPQVTAVHQRLGRLLGRMEALGFTLRTEAELQTLTLDVLKNSEIEGEILNSEQVRSSIARRLGIQLDDFVTASRDVEGVVEMMLDATQHFDKPLTKERLWDWHAALFPTGRSGMHQILVGAWRDDSQGPMQIVSGPHGHERVHFEAPEAPHLEKEMKIFLQWFNLKQTIDPILKAGIAHLWFVTVHPFDDGNGRIARTITDMQLARVGQNTQRFYSMSAQILRERKVYYDILERTTKGSLNITAWLEWFLACLERSLIATENTLGDILRKARFWETNAMLMMNERQRLMLNKLLDGFTGKLTSSKWAKITKCSQDTALRDILDLVGREILVKDAAGGRSTSYSMTTAFI